VVELGYSLSSEEFGPLQIVENARNAEKAGFAHALVSDHFHPWLDQQGESPFVWSTIGAISQATESLTVGTGVTCPLIRIHPAIVAQAAATSAALMPGRFFLGVGTGENLNEHILGDRWPAHEERAEMLDEAVGVMRELWQGGLVSHRGAHYTVDRARLYSLPDKPPKVVVAAAGPHAAALAGRIGDALIATAPDEDLVAAFREAGGAGKPCFGQLTACYAASEDEAAQVAFDHWPNGALPGDLGQELGLPRFFRQATGTLTREDVATSLTCGSDPDLFHEAIDEYVRAGFDRVYIHQVGTEQSSFLDFCARELIPVRERQATANSR
jgi:G6PDH family F420-dependent oxidoreductase